MESYRQFVQERVEARQRAKTAPKQPACEHDWRDYRQSVPIDNLNFKKSDAYFVVRGCSKCKAKVMVDYVME